MPTTDIDQINEGKDGSSPTENANATEVDIAAGALVGLSAGASGGSGADNADDTTEGAGINNTTNTNEGGTAATSATPKTPTQNKDIINIK